VNSPIVLLLNCEVLKSVKCTNSFIQSYKMIYISDENTVIFCKKIGVFSSEIYNFLLLLTPLGNFHTSEWCAASNTLSRQLKKNKHVLNNKEWKHVLVESQNTSMNLDKSTLCEKKATKVAISLIYDACD